MSEREAMDRVDASPLAAFLQWRKLTHEDRASPSHQRIGQTVCARYAEELAALMTEETGKLLKDGLVEVEICARHL